MKRNAVLLLMLATAADGQTVCGTNGTISIAGSSTVQPVAQAWGDAYTNQCPGTIFTIEGGGSSAGAGRVCANEEKGSPVMIGDMSREWKPTEGETEDGWTYQCATGDTNREAAQFPVAVDGISVIASTGGPAADCFEILGGLTTDQLRYAFSSYSTEQLTETGWDPSSVPNLLGDDASRLWAEFNSSCVAQDIKISGPGPEHGTYDFFMETILTDSANGETFADWYVEGNNSDIVSYVEEIGAAMAYVGYAVYSQNSDSLTAAAIENDEGEFVEPTATTVGDGSYNPLGRFIYMNLNSDANDLSITLPFLEFGYSTDGDALVEQVGYVPLTPEGKTQMKIERMPILYDEFMWTDEQKADYWCGGESTVNMTVAGSSTVFPVINGWAEEYAEYCPGFAFTIEGGGSSSGAGRVCANPDREGPVMIGSMSREWKDTEATTTDGITYECLAPGNEDITVTQLVVGLDGISVVVAEGGAAEECIDALGGLTTDQLRWMYSSYTAAELEGTDWEPDSIPNSDGDDTTHLWSELDASCPAEEIKIAGPGSEHGTYEFFMEVILTDSANGETYRAEYNDGVTTISDEEFMTSAKSAQDGIAFMGYASYLENDDTLTAIAVENEEGIYVAPSAKTIANGSYTPLTREIFINVNNEFIDDVFYFLRFAWSGDGTGVVGDVGYVPVSASPALWQEGWTSIEDVVGNKGSSWERKNLRH